LEWDCYEDGVVGFGVGEGGVVVLVVFCSLRSR